MREMIETDCTIAHDGRSFTAAGAVVTADYVVAYVGKLLGDRVGIDAPTGRRALTDWHGNRIGDCALGDGWRVESYMGNRMYQIYALIQGRAYTGRGFGEGMSVFMRPTADQRRKDAANAAR